MTRTSRERAVGQVGGESRPGPSCISIEGIEATQAIQFYRSRERLDAASAEPDNAIPLIAGKPLAVRVYTDLRVPPALEGKLPIDGELWYREAGGGGPWQAAWRFPGTVGGKPAAKIDCGRAADTLNFRISGRDATGRLEVRASVRTDLPGAGRVEASTETGLSFIAAPPLRLWLHGIRCRTGATDLPSPTPVEALETTAFLRKTYPTARIEVVGYGVLDFEGDFEGSTAAGPGVGWRVLLLRLYRLRRAGGNREIHYGLLPRDAPTGPFGGYGSHLGVGASRAGEQTAMAQEIGHALGRKHAPGSGDPEIDPSYPDYGGLPPGSIGEHGFDVSTGETFSPGSVSDFMTNRGRYWVSPHTYRGILNALLAREDEARGAKGEAPVPRPPGSLEGTPAASLALEITSPRVPPPPATVSGQAEVRWKVSCAHPSGLAFQLRYSADGGRSWTPVDAGLEYGKARLDFDRLPGGDDSRLEVMASTFLETASARIGPLRVARKPRRAMIAGAGGGVLAPQGFIELAGCAHSADGFAPEADLAWWSSIQGLLGTGSVLFATGLLPGEHVISLVAPDGVGGETRAGAIVRVPVAVAGEVH